MSKRPTFIFYSGQARTFASCFYNQYWNVLRKLDNPEFFVCVANDEKSSTMELLEKRFPKERIHYQIPFQPTFPEADFLEDKNLFSAYPRSSPVLSVLRAFWFYQESWKMAGDRPAKENAICIRLRPDIWFMDYNHPAQEIFPTDCYTVPWGAFGGVNDRFAVMGHVAAEGYFTTLSKFGQLTEMGCPIHPETMTKASVELVGGNCKQTLMADYRTRRLPDPKHAEAEKRTNEWYQFDPVGAYEMMKVGLTPRP